MINVTQNTRISLQIFDDSMAHVMDLSPRGHPFNLLLKSGVKTTVFRQVVPRS
jgi:hypothetical protein